MKLQYLLLTFSLLFLSCNDDKLKTNSQPNIILIITALIMAQTGIVALKCHIDKTQRGLPLMHTHGLENLADLD